MGLDSLLQQNMQDAGLAGIDRLAGNAMYPQSHMDKTQYAVPTQMPTSAEVMRSDYDAPTAPYTGMQPQMMAKGGIASIPRYDGEDGSLVETPVEPTAPPTMAELATQLNEYYRSNQNYDDLYKQFAATKEQDPKEWYKHQLAFLGGQQGWQIGQNTSERNAALQPQIEDTIAQAKSVGLDEKEITNVLGSSAQAANAENQRRIIAQQQAGGGAMGMTPKDYLTVAAILGGGAAAAYFAPAAAATGALEAGGALTTAELLGGAGGAFVPTAGSGASFVLPEALSAAGTTLGGSTAAGADIFGGLAGTEGAYGSLTAAEQAAQLTGAAGGMGPTYAELGYTGIGTPETMKAIAAADAAAKAAEGGMTAKQAMNLYRGANMLNSAFGGGEAQAGYGAMPTVAAPATIPNITRSGVTGYYGAAEAPDYRSIMALQKTPYLSKIRGGYGETAFAAGGIADLGSYSDGGRLLKGPGDGMSDHIPAKIGDAQPARLADGEFVVPADVVSHLGNGSTDAGAKQLYAMMDKVRKARTGNKKQGKQINPSKFLP